MGSIIMELLSLRDHLLKVKIKWGEHIIIIYDREGITFYVGKYGH